MHFFNDCREKKSNEPAKIIPSNSIEAQINKTLRHFPKLYLKGEALAEAVNS